MGKIVYITDMEEGHTIPTFGLARSLQQRGHEIAYLGIADNQQMVNDQGFDFYPILQNIYPKGFRQNFKKNSHLPQRERVNDLLKLRRQHIEYALNGAYSHALNTLNADLYLVNFHLTFDIFILYYKYQIRPVILNSSLRVGNKSLTFHCMDFINSCTLEEKYLLIDFLTKKGINFTSFDELVSPLGLLNELIICPGEFQVNPPTGSNIKYIEPSIRKVASTVDVYKTYSIPASKKIIYASMGSQAIRHGAICDLFFGKVINIMKRPESSDLHLILCVGQEFDKSKLLPVADNITLLEWGPQIDILKVASVAIIHGGLGSIKECIYFGVPMIIFPQGFDQPENAKCVAHHKLGFADSITMVSEDSLQKYITNILQDDEIKNAVRSMQKIFREKEESQPGVQIIEEILALSTTKTRSTYAPLHNL